MNKEWFMEWKKTPSKHLKYRFFPEHLPAIFYCINTEKNSALSTKSSNAATYILDTKELQKAASAWLWGH